MATVCDISGQKPDITYPCDWEYKVIVPKGTDLESICKEILTTKKYNLTPSKKSKTDKYESFSLLTNVISEEERGKFFRDLKNHKDIKYVL